MHRRSRRLVLAYDVIRRGGTSGCDSQCGQRGSGGAFLSAENADGGVVPFGLIADLVAGRDAGC